MKRKTKYNEINFDEIFLDSKNIAGFERERFEGRIEKSLEKRFFLSANFIFFIFLSIIFSKAFYLQIIKGDEFRIRSEDNHLRLAPVFSPRGLIYDRNGEKLAWNEIEYSENIPSDSERKEEKNSLEKERPVRKFNKSFSGLAHLLGYLGYPSDSFKTVKNKNAQMQFADQKMGKAGVEKYYNDLLEGETGYKIIEVNSRKSLVSENIRKETKPSESLILSIDAKLNSKAYEIVSEVMDDRGFSGGTAIIMDIKTGEILVMASAPEYDSQILSEGKDSDKINSFLKNPKKPFINRVISGLYPPGSIIKPLVALASLNEGVISADKIIETHGSISLPNPYFPDKKSVFPDWKNHGPVDMRRALAVSSNVYFYTVGGGYGDIKGLGAENINKYARMFNFGEKTGIDLNGEQKGYIPVPKDKEKLNPVDPLWRVGDTYNMSIGQGWFQITPIQTVVYVAAIANEGIIVKPRLAKLCGNKDNDCGLLGEQSLKLRDLIDRKHFKTVKEGMRLAVLEGTAKALDGLGVTVAGKTGTAQTGTKRLVNSWFIGFFPYEEPRYAISVVLESGSEKNLIGAPFAARRIIEWMSLYAPRYF